MNRIEQHEFNVYDKKRKFSGYISLGICAFCFMVVWTIWAYYRWISEGPPTFTPDLYTRPVDVLLGRPSSRERRNPRFDAFIAANTPF